MLLLSETCAVFTAFEGLLHLHTTSFPEKHAFAISAHAVNVVIKPDFCHACMQAVRSKLSGSW